MKKWLWLIGLLWLVACTRPGTVELTVALPTISPTASLPRPPIITLPPVSTPTASPTATLTTANLPFVVAQPTATPTLTPTPTPLTFAVIGDYGSAGPAEAGVADLVHGWQPALIITVGDNNYPYGEASTIGANIGDYYGDYIAAGRFFPSLGNHDWANPEGADPYLAYFDLPGNERYYDFTAGPVHFFAVDSDWNEPDGNWRDSVQGLWLQEGLAAAGEPWKIVYFHFPPYSSGYHGSTPIMQWPFAEWGASIVLSGHDHTYERLLVNGFPYIVNGLGGYPARYSFDNLLPQSLVRFNDDYGAMLVTASPQAITFQFFTQFNQLIDSFTLTISE